MIHIFSDIQPKSLSLAKQTCFERKRERESGKNGRHFLLLVFFETFKVEGVSYLTVYYVRVDLYKYINWAWFYNWKRIFLSLFLPLTFSSYIPSLYLTCAFAFLSEVCHKQKCHQPTRKLVNKTLSKKKVQFRMVCNVIPSIPRNQPITNKIWLLLFASDYLHFNALVDVRVRFCCCYFFVRAFQRLFQFQHLACKQFYQFIPTLLQASVTDP